MILNEGGWDSGWATSGRPRKPPTVPPETECLPTKQTLRPADPFDNLTIVGLRCSSWGTFAGLLLPLSSCNCAVNHGELVTALAKYDSGRRIRSITSLLLAYLAAALECLQACNFV
ncbi:hypothetical protein J6590_066833 [Homalodisca vitripennis]|nr:hypothetical protein J6590_066833 [Homalodisca vitripennis]